jgi:outer membrane immunogenic protein
VIVSEWGRVMKKLPIVVIAVAAFAAAGPALAAEAEAVVTPGPFDAPPAFPARRVYDRPPVYEPAVVPDVFTAPPAFPAVRLYNWTGAYVGINGGGAWARPDWTSVPDATSGTYNLSGGLAGGTLGYNLQTNEPFVWSVEGDFAWSGVRGTVPPASCVPSCEMQSNWLGTARLRLGYAFDTIMPYATAGAAFSRLVASTAGAPFGTESKNNLGWTLGLGVEFVVWGLWTAKAEYLYADFNGFSCNVACGGGPISFNVRENIVRVGLNYRIWQR